MRPTASALLRTSGASAVLITNLVNIRYITGISLTAGILLASKRGYVLFVDARYAEAAATDVAAGVQVRGIEKLQQYLASVPVCGFEAEDVSVARLGVWRTRMKNTKFVQSKGLVEGFRRSKDHQELLRLKRARKIARELLRRVPSALRATLTERALAWRLEQWARELGAQKLSFEPIVAFGSHTSRPHHRPTDKQLRRGHIVQIDVGVVYKGYCSDVSDVFFTADPKPEEAKAVEAVSAAKDRVFAALRTGARADRLDALAREVLATFGMEDAFCHALGHGVGLEVHEGITLSSRSREAVVAGEVLAVEPGVYFPGKFGVRIEDMAFIASDKA